MQEDVRQPARSLADGLPQLPGSACQSNALPEEPDKTQVPALIAEPAPGSLQATLDNLRAPGFGRCSRHNGSIGTPIEIFLDTGNVHAAVGQKVIIQNTDGSTGEFAEKAEDLYL
jgi:hypothetical protein